MGIQRTTMGRLMIDQALPASMRGRNMTLDAKGIQELFTDIATNHPELYGDIAKKLLSVGKEGANITGGYSVGLQALRQPKSAKLLRQKYNDAFQAIYAQGLPEAEQNKLIIDTAIKAQKEFADQVYDESVAENNPIAQQIISGAKGNKGNLNSLRGADMLYTDHKGEYVPIPILRNYSMGLSPAEYFAGAFGARKGVIDLKRATQDAGFFAKQLVQAAHRLVVTADDSDEPYDLTNPRGLPVDTDDKYNIGAVLAHDVGGYTRNTVLTPKILKELKTSGHDRILVRSPTVGGPKDGGVYRQDVGVRERGGLSPIGDFVGNAGAQAIAEPVTQASISSKHCLAAGTLVRMADWSVKPIEQIAVGDLVLGADKTANTFEVRVINVFDNGVRDCYCTNFRWPNKQKSMLFSTLEHKVLMLEKTACTATTKKKQVPQILAVGTTGRGLKAVTAGGTTISRHKPIPAGLLQTHDIEVDHPDHLFVLANGLIVSNSGGVAGGSAGAISGFKLFNNLVQVPKTFTGGATHAQKDGRVQLIQEAPQGGHYVTIDSEKHYVPAGVPVTVKLNQEIEAGDMISEGMANPAEIVKHKGIGEGRRNFAMQFLKAMQDSKTKANRRNVEILARGLINHVRLTDEVGDAVPGELYPYQFLEATWQPREGYKVSAPTEAKGMYLEKPVLHYSIGTRVRPSVIKEMQHFGVTQVHAHKDPPPFEFEMLRGMANASEDEDWMTNMLGGYQKNSLMDATHRGRVSDEAGSSYVPALAHGANFGLKGLTKGFDPATIKTTPPSAL